MTMTHKLKIMILNPMGRPDLNKTFADMAKTLKDANTSVTVASLNPSAGVLDPMAVGATTSIISADILRACFQARKEGYDAIISNCFGDLAVDVSREIAGNMAVIGPCKSSIQIALQLGKRYSIIIPYSMCEDIHNAQLREYGSEHKPVSYRSLDMMFGGDRSELETRVYTQAKLAMECDGAEVVIIGCTLGLGYAQKVQESLGIPVIEAAPAALKTAELMAQMRRHGGWGAPNKTGGKDTTREELESRGLFQEAYIFGERVEVE